MGENNAKREIEIGVLASYISLILLVFTGSVNVNLDEMLDGVCCPLGVLVGVSCAATCVDGPCAEPCHGVMGVDGATTG